MKKLRFLSALFVFAFFALNATAQTDVFYYEDFPWDLYVVDCDEMDYLSGTVHVQLIHHYNPKTGTFEWYINRWKADLESQVTTEIFSVKFFARGITNGDFNTWEGDHYIYQKFNAKGNMGSHYIGSITWFWDSSTYSFSKVKVNVKCL